MLQSLLYYWRINLAVLLAAAVATAVLTGALLVGDSVRGSLRELTLERLGKIDFAVLSETMFREELASGIENTPRFRQNFSNAVPALLLQGAAVQADSKQRASQVQITGIDSRFVNLFEFPSDRARSDLIASLNRRQDQIFPSLVINESLAKELSAKIGDPVVFSFQKESYVPSESILGYKDPSEFIRSLRLTVTMVIPDRGIGRFGLSSNQNLPFNAFVSLPVLQRALEQQSKVNALLLSAKSFESGSTENDLLKDIQPILSQSLNLEDLGIMLHNSEKYFVIESREVLLKDPIARLAQQIGSSMKTSQQHILTYLANRISANGRSIPYSTITALETPVPESFGFLKMKDGGTAKIGTNEIILGEWAAEDLKVKTGDSIKLSYFVAGSANQLITQEHEFVLKAISTLQGLGVDENLAPEYPGIQDAQHISDWSPPFPVDLSLIRPIDEEYWNQYRAAPKGFISLKTGQQLWKSRFGSLTSIRIAPAAGLNVAETAQIFSERFLKDVSTKEFGFTFQPVKEQGLNAAAGSTDFGTLFIGFSLFLIVSASLLVALLFRLGVELRAPELGILLSAGYQVRQVRRRFLTEGLLLALFGALLGVFGAVAYAWLLLNALKTWWLAAVGSPFLSLHVNPISLLIGFLLSLTIVTFSIWRAVARLAKLPAPLLLSGSIAGFDKPGSSRRWKWIGFSFLILSISFALYAVLSEKSASPGLFFLIGSFCLITGLTFFSVWLRFPRRKTIPAGGIGAMFRMAIRNSVRNPGRSLLSAALVCCACFVIIAVGANRVQPEAESGKLSSGTGGYSLVAQSDIPVVQNLNDKGARLTIGLPEPKIPMDRYHFESFRVLPGDDVSCLNLYRPQRPRILGVPNDQIRRGGFVFSNSLAITEEEKKNPWRLLNREIGPDTIPAIGDANSVNWILHLGLGKEMAIIDGLGKPLRLRIVGLLKGSIFQSELLISEKDFVKHFPDQNGYSYFLIETEAGKREEIANMLENSMANFGFDAIDASEKLASYQVVENTYLSTFQTLGGLGLILGTLGLGIILVRNAIERRGELATLRAFGYKRSALGWLVLTENGILLLCGILIGTISALIAVTPHLLLAGADFPWFSLSVTLIFVFVIGMIASAVATGFALRIPLLPALKAE